MPVVALMNNKGGVGKTTLTAVLAATLARRGSRVLAIDMDPQANLSRRLGFPEPTPEHDVATLAEALKANIAGCAADIVTPCRWEDDTAARVDLLPSRFDLENRISEAGTVGAHLRLVNITGDMIDSYDWTLIDCPPSIGHLTQMAMVLAGQRRAGRAGYVLVVTEPEYDSMRGAQRVVDFVGANAGALSVPDLRVIGVVINQVRQSDLTLSNASERTGLHAENVTDIHAAFGELVWEPLLPLWTVVAEAQGAAVPVHTMDVDRAQLFAARLDVLADRMMEGTA